MCDWALNRKGVEAVLAETSPDGAASQRILKRCGCDKYREEETTW